MTGSRFESYERSERVPNIVVDGSPNAATVLTLTHWPGQPQPLGTAADTSAEMAFRFLDEPVEHEPAEVVTNNHFDQDGAVGLFALIEPEVALLHRERLIDLAEAGDFAVYRSRNAARASMTLHAYADPDRSPVASSLTGDHEVDTAVLYATVLPLLAEMLTNPDRHRSLWQAEDDSLSASEEAIADQWVAVSEDLDLDLALVEVDGAEPERLGHRFSHQRLGPLHPMAIHNATERSRLLTVHGRRFQYIDRYETWVQFRSRRPPQRVDLRPLARRLTEADHGATWAAQAPSTLTPMLTHDTDSALSATTVRSLVDEHLRSTVPAWDPYAR